MWLLWLFVLVEQERETPRKEKLYIYIYHFETPTHLCSDLPQCERTKIEFDVLQENWFQRAAPDSTYVRELVWLSGSATFREFWKFASCLCCCVVGALFGAAALRPARSWYVPATRSEKPRVEQHLGRQFWTSGAQKRKGTNKSIDSRTCMF